MVQSILAGCTIGLALFYLTKKTVKRFSNKKHGCDSCAMGKSSQVEQRTILK